MLERNQQTYHFRPSGAKLTIWRKTAKGKFRACVNFPNGEFVATEDFRFVTPEDAQEWGREKVRAANAERRRAERRDAVGA